MEEETARPTAEHTLRRISALLGALVGGRGHHEAFALAGVLALAIVLCALAGTLSLARVRADALDARGAGATRRQGAFLRHGGRRQKQRGDCGSEHRTPGSAIHRILLVRIQRI